MIGKQTIFSKGNDEWETPQDIFDELDREFNFNLDPCATEKNRKCEWFYTKEEDGLTASWKGYRAFVNPPYSDISRWVEKAYYETRNVGTLSVMLIPSSTDTKYFHDFIYHRAEIRFIKGRLRFSNSKNPAPFPSMIVIFRGPKTD